MHEISSKYIPSVNISTSSEGTSNTAPIPSAVSAMPLMAEIFSSGSILLNIVKANLQSNQLNKYDCRKATKINRALCW
jgi:hypothetical protein